MDIDSQLLEFRKLIEDAIEKLGTKGKESLIRSSKLINLIHDSIKNDLINAGIHGDNIYPHIYESCPEIRIAGGLKQKDQDICVIPSKIKCKETVITWGPMAFEKKMDKYGYDFSNNTLVINVRSQMSSLAKNADTLFERTFAEALNLHMRYPNMVLGEVYLIPVQEYDENSAKKNIVKFSEKYVDIMRYISFFNAINNRKSKEDSSYAYERCSLLIVDFSQPKPKLFENSKELKDAGLLPKDFPIEYATLNYHTFVKDILKVYEERFDISKIKNSWKYQEKIINSGSDNNE